MKKYDLIIIGAGPAGLTAGIYAQRSNLAVVVLEKEIAGGQIRSTSEIENWPGTMKITGAELADNFKTHAESLKVEIVSAEVLELTVEKDYKIVKTTDKTFKSKAVIIASGTKFNKLGVKGEEEFIGRGVSYCAVCDGPFFKNETVAVVGGGNAAVEEALFLTNFATKVYLIHRRDEFRATPMVLDRALNNPKIHILTDTVVEEILGESAGVKKIKIKNLKKDKSSELEVTGIFLYVGTKAQTDFAKNIIEHNENGWIKVNQNLETNQKGIYAAGDIRENSIRQVVTAAGDGAQATINSYHFLKNIK